MIKYQLDQDTMQNMNYVQQLNGFNTLTQQLGVANAANLNAQSTGTNSSTSSPSSAVAAAAASGVPSLVVVNSANPLALNSMNAQAAAAAAAAAHQYAALNVAAAAAAAANGAAAVTNGSEFKFELKLIFFFAK